MIGVLHPKPPHQSQWEYWGAAPQTSSPVSMALLACCTPNLLTSLNGIIGVLYPKPPHQSQWEYWGAAPQTSSPVSMGLLGCCTPNLLTSLNGNIAVIHSKTYQSQSDYWGTAPQTSSLVYQWDDWGAAPQTSSPVSIRLLGYCTPNLLTSLNGIIGVLYPKTPHKFLKPPDQSQ